MARPRTPSKKAALTGAAQHDPQRFRDRSEPVVSDDPVGAPPSYLSADAKAVWRECARDMGWLVRADRHALEAMCVAMGQVRSLTKQGEVVPASMLSAANTAIGKIGASPTDRSKVFQQKDDDDTDDPFAAFGAMN